jgi:hypothetical protein
MVLLPVVAVAVVQELACMAHLALKPLIKVLVVAVAAVALALTAGALVEVEALILSPASNSPDSPVELALVPEVVAVVLLVLLAQPVEAMAVQAVVEVREAQMVVVPHTKMPVFPALRVLALVPVITSLVIHLSLGLLLEHGKVT